MARYSSINLVLIFSVLLMVMLTAEGEPTASQSAVPLCKVVHSVQQGESCSSLSEDFSIDMAHFLEINPNINCDAIFVGQWVCVNGKLP